MTVVATVGTTHPLAFAGLAFAVLALAADAVRPVCVVAGVTAQDADRVRASVAVDAGTIRAQFDALRDANVGAFHVGALVSADAVRAVADALAAYPNVPVVVDPVLAASGGDALADDATRTALRDALFARATLITPNLDEAGAFLGYDVRGVDAMRAAARELLAFGARAVLVKGGHLTGDAIDVLAGADGTREFSSPRVDGTLRGTGDLLAVTIAAELARGAALDAAIERARRRVGDAIAHGVQFAGARVAPLASARAAPLAKTNRRASARAAACLRSGRACRGSPEAAAHLARQCLEAFVYARETAFHSPLETVGSGGKTSVHVAQANRLQLGGFLNGDHQRVKVIDTPRYMPDAL